MPLPRAVAAAPAKGTGPTPGAKPMEPPAAEEAPATRARGASRSRPPWAVAALVAVLATPLVVALAVLAEPRWYPSLDLAMTELQVRDVASADPPLLGSHARIGTLERPGNHPGPLSFFALWPLYQLFGATSWALQAAGVGLHVLAVAVALWIARRRGGMSLAVAIAAVLAVLLRAYGPATLTEPWNPYLALTWFVVLVLSVWSVLDDDVAMLPVAVFAGSFCMQAHIPYLGLGGGLLALAAVGAATSVLMGRSEPERRRAVLRWGLLSAGVAAVVWGPPLVDQIIRSPGNLGILVDHFGDPPERPIGLRRGAEVLLVHLDPRQLFVGLPPRRGHVTTSVVPGAVLLAGWAATVVAGRRLRHRALLRLDLVLAVALALGLASASRIPGPVWFYLTLWAYGLSALMAFAMGWTFVAAWSRRSRAAATDARRPMGVGTAVLVGVTLVASALMTVDAASVEAPDAALSIVLRHLVPPTAEALGSDLSRDGRYLVTWDDPITIGAQGWGLLAELDRLGYDVGVREQYRAGAGPHRVIRPDEASVVVHLAIGTAVGRWRAEPRAREVAYFDRRSPAERAEFQRLRTDVVSRLEAAGLADLVPGVDANLFITSLDPRVPGPVQRDMERMLTLGLPAAVFVGPPEAAG